MKCIAHPRALRFQSTPPVKAATFDGKIFCCLTAISIHAAREGGDATLVFCRSDHQISIHAAREGGDMEDKQRTYGWNISIHAAREGGDDAPPPKRWLKDDFNPRRP